MKCLACNNDNPQHAKFCSACGAVLADDRSAKSPAPPVKGASGSESAQNASPGVHQNGAGPGGGGDTMHEINALLSLVEHELDGVRKRWMAAGPGAAPRAQPAGPGVTARAQPAAPSVTPHAQPAGPSAAPRAQPAGPSVTARAQPSVAARADSKYIVPCPRCGTALERGASRCRECGASLSIFPVADDRDTAPAPSDDRAIRLVAGSALDSDPEARRHVAAVTGGEVPLPGISALQRPVEDKASEKVEPILDSPAPLPEWVDGEPALDTSGRRFAVQGSVPENVVPKAKSRRGLRFALAALIAVMVFSGVGYYLYLRGFFNVERWSLASPPAPDGKRAATPAIAPGANAVPGVARKADGAMSAAVVAGADSHPAVAAKSGADLPASGPTNPGANPPASGPTKSGANSPASGPTESGANLPIAGPLKPGAEPPVAGPAKFAADLPAGVPAKPVTNAAIASGNGPNTVPAVPAAPRTDTPAAVAGKTGAQAQVTGATQPSSSTVAEQSDATLASSTTRPAAVSAQPMAAKTTSEPAEEQAGRDSERGAGDSKPGKGRLALKTTLPQNSAKKAVALSDLLRLKDPPNPVKNDPRYRAQLIPPFPNSSGLREGDIVTTTGWLHAVALEPDGGYSIQLSDSSTSGDRCLVAEVPRADPRAIGATELRGRLDQVRAFVRAKLLRGKEPSSGGSVMGHPIRIRLTGQLLYDDAYVGEPPRGKRGMRAATLWALHPVTDIGFASAPD
jgi:hypothetical protein